MSKKSKGCVFIVFNGGLGVHSKHKTFATAKKSAKKLSFSDNATVKKYCISSDKLTRLLDCNRPGKCKKIKRK